MGGGLMQLVAYGAQDVYLTSNAQITFFKVVYRRHTNFAMESIEQTFNGSPALGRTAVATISRNGDLVMGLWLKMTFTISSSSGVKYAAYCLGYACLKTVELEIGGQTIDKHYGEWMNIYAELTTPMGKRVLFDRMVGSTVTIDSSNPYGPASGSGTAGTAILNVPLQFWFCRNPGLALPLIALQYHEVKVRIEFETAANVAGNSNGVSMTECQLWADYVYLDTDERRRFAQISHEYLFEQLQHTGSESIAASSKVKTVDLNLNHPVKELIWTIKEDSVTANPCGPYVATADTALIKLNGHDRFAERDKTYFLDVQQYKHHTHGARVGTPSTSQQQYYYVYSFALSPEEHQPSGTCNFSRIDTAQLRLTSSSFSASTLKLYAVNYNVLRIMSGMAGTAFAN